MATEYKSVALPECEALVDEPVADEEWTGATAVDWSTGEVLRVHPLAAKFPMLGPVEFAELVEDLRENGLAQPIVLDSDRMLIDGRNRIAGCAEARRDPSYVLLPPGTNVVAYILSLNVHRRHLNKGQRAMAAAVGLNSVLNTEFGSKAAAARAAEVSASSVSHANLVYHYLPALVDEVFAGRIGLNEAYADALAAKKAEDECEDTIAEVADTAATNLQRVHDHAPDLVELIAEERISLNDAITILDQREAEAAAKVQVERERQERVTLSFARATASLHAILRDPEHDIAKDWLPEANTMDDIAGLQTLWTADGLADIAERLRLVAEAWQDETEED